MNLSSKNKAIQELQNRAMNGMIHPVQFMKHYWQKRPLLVRAAFPAFRDPLSRDELAGLACEENLESRLVMERGGTKPWQVIPGPQRATHLRQLPSSHWTLLVQGMDRFIPGVAALLDTFRFLPDWRVDDVMVSFAPRGGTVGPHIDSYDVFLLQGQGRRRWRIDSRSPQTLRSGLDLRILKQFKTEQEWVLESGDMLYLPPNLAHYGVALEECLTYSIGFRSPSAMDLLTAVQERLMQVHSPESRYQDPGLKSVSVAGEIPRAAIRALRQLLTVTLNRLPHADFDDLVGQLLTEPKGFIVPDQRRVNVAAFRSRAIKGGTLVRTAGSRMGFVRQGKTTALFVEGRRFDLHSQMAFAAPLLTGERRLSAQVWVPHLEKKHFVQLVATLIGMRVFRLER